MSKSVTRGHGILEKFLARKRCEMANRLIPENARNGKVLDVGCGTHPFFLLNTEFFEKYGVDQLVKKRDVNTFKKSHIKLFPHDINRNIALPFTERYFDVVIMLAVCEHLRAHDLLVLLKDVKRVLKKDGYFIYTTPTQKSDPILKLMSIFNIVSREEIEEHKEYYDKEKMEKFLLKAGFEKSKMEFGKFEFGFNNWGVIKK